MEENCACLVNIQNYPYTVPTIIPESYTKSYEDITRQLQISVDIANSITRYCYMYNITTPVKITVINVNKSKYINMLYIDCKLVNIIIKPKLSEPLTVSSRLGSIADSTTIVNTDKNPSSGINKNISQFIYCTIRRLPRKYINK
jgi:hypothetical protein